MDTKAAQRQLVTLITQHLSNSIPVTRILTYKPDKNGSVTGRFESLGRVFNFAFNGNDVRYKPSGNMDSDLFSEYYLQRFDAAPATPRGTRALPKCTSKSYSCKGEKGVRCLPLTLNCKMGTDAIGNERLGKIKNLSKSLASSGEDNSKVEAARAKIIEGRLALAVENRAKKKPKKRNKKESSLKTNEQKKELNLSRSELDKNLSQWLDSLHSIPNTEKEKIENLKDNKDIIRGMQDGYSSSEFEDSEIEGSNHLTVLDRNGKMQAALIYQVNPNKGLEIELLATAPWNLQEDHPNKQKGSGAKAIVKAIQKSQELGLDGKISLDALPKAMPFYEHLGFIKEPNSASIGSMTLSAEAASKLLGKYK